MKRLLLMRHAKSDWIASFGHDHERPLAPRGLRAARLMGRFLQATDRVPSRIVSSSAVRARTTVALAAEAGAWSLDDQALVIRRDLYLTTPDHLIDVVRAQPDDADPLMLAGHEPSWSQLVGRLIGGARCRFPTAAVACLRFETDAWSSIAAGQGTLEWLVTPKRLAALDPDQRSS